MKREPYVCSMCLQISLAGKVEALIEQYGARPVLEAVAGYVKKYLGLDVWAEQINRAASLLAAPKEE